MNKYHFIWFKLNRHETTWLIN